MIDPTLFPLEDINPDPQGNPDIIQANLNAFVENLQDFFSTVLVHNMDADSFNVESIARSPDDPKSQACLTELLELVTYACAFVDDKEEHLGRMMNLPTEHQDELMDAIEKHSEMGNEGPGMDSTINFELNSSSVHDSVEFKELEQEKEVLENKVNSLKEQLRDREARCDALASEKGSLENRVEELNSENGELKAKLKEQNRTANLLEDAKMRNNRMMTEMEQLKQQMESLRGEKDKEIESLKLEMDSRRREFEQVLEGKENELALHRQREQGGASSDEKGNIEMVVLKQNLDEAKGTISDLNNQLVVTKQQLEQAKAAAASSVDTSNVVINGVSQETYNDLKQEYKELKEELKERQNQIQKLYEEVAAQKDTLLAKDKEINAIKMAHLELTNQMDQGKTDRTGGAGGDGNEYYQAALELEQKLKVSQEREAKLVMDLKEAKNIMNSLDEEANKRQTAMVKKMKERVNDYKVQIEAQLQQKNDQIEYYKGQVLEIKDSANMEQRLMISVFYEMGQELQRLKQLQGNNRSHDPKATLNKFRKQVREGSRSLQK
eukprot:TRINITY_DN5577_c0_g1_i1.p1 TRINITY_DN5577_c0_g1~~TRINITY_DN5577_c0_g1_i1.p1  ORF type:complete len:588 (-),score=232.94 TRINITY_DN5577_c0_g1_i1:1069-2724(-)